jgi:hypothetical protein
VACFRSRERASLAADQTRAIETLKTEKLGLEIEVQGVQDGPHRLEITVGDKDRDPIFGAPSTEYRARVSSRKVVDVRNKRRPDSAPR